MTPLHNLVDGDINVLTFVLLGIGYVILAGMMGIKWGLLYRMTGNLYDGCKKEWTLGTPVSIVRMVMKRA